MHSVRVAVIGVGSIGSQHARVYHDMPDVQLEAVCDANYDQALEVFSQYKAHSFYTDYHVMLADRLIDAVSIAVPTLQHATIAMEVMKWGKPVLVEKPIAHTSAYAYGLLSMAKEYGVILMPGHIERFNPAVVKLLQEVETLGDIIHIDAVRRGPQWWGCPGRPCAPDLGMTMELGVHELDIAHQIAGEVVECSAQSIWRNKHDVATNALLRFRSDTLMTLTVSCLSLLKERSLSVTGEDAVLRLDYQDQTLTRTEDVTWMIEVERAEPLKLELSHFIECVRTGTQPRVTPDDGVWAVRMAERILECTR